MKRTKVIRQCRDVKFIVLSTVSGKPLAEFDTEFDADAYSAKVNSEPLPSLPYDIGTEELA